MTGSNIRLPGSLAELTESECTELLSNATVGRIAYVNDEGQQLIPVNYVMSDGLIYFRTTSGGVLAELWRGHDDVAFGVDHHDDRTHDGWNVTAKGSARKVEDRATINRVLTNPNLRPWAGGIRSTVVEIRPRALAGRVVAHTSVEP